MYLTNLYYLTMRLYMPLILVAVFLGWVLYRAFIKKDLKQNLTSLYAGLAFLGVWGVIYYWLIK